MVEINHPLVLTTPFDWLLSLSLILMLNCNYKIFHENIVLINLI